MEAAIEMAKYNSRKTKGTRFNQMRRTTVIQEAANEDEGNSDIVTI